MLELYSLLCFLALEAKDDHSSNIHAFNYVWEKTFF